MSNRKNRKKSSGTEYCAGFRDEHGQWNNGFYCPKWGGPDIKYCCGPKDHKYCCPKEESLEQLHSNQAQQLSLLIGLAVGSFILLMGTLLITCYFCRCCWAYKRRKRSHAGSPVLPAYPGYARDSTDPVNYAICPHGTVLPGQPEYLVAAPRYPTDAPPPYPGHEAPAMENKESLPPPHVQEHGDPGHTRSHRPSNIQRSISHPERSTTERHSTERDRLHSDYLSDRSCHAMDLGATAVIGQGRTPPDAFQGCYDERQSQRTNSVSGGPSTSSRRISHHIPKIKSSSHRSKRRSGYDSRSISSDSDTFSS